MINRHKSRWFHMDHVNFQRWDLWSKDIYKGKTSCQNHSGIYHSNTRLKMVSQTHSFITCTSIHSMMDHNVTAVHLGRNRSSSLYSLCFHFFYTLRTWFSTCFWISPCPFICSSHLATASFEWQRGRQYDYQVALFFFTLILQAKQVEITNIEAKDRIIR